MTQLRTEHDEAARKTESDYWAEREANSRLNRQRDALLPVVEAARAWAAWHRSQILDRLVSDKEIALTRAVDALDSGSGTEVGDG